MTARRLRLADSASGLRGSDHLEVALTIIAGEPIETICAGRTDAGFHAFAQVVHFDTTARRANRRGYEGQRGLPTGVAVVWARGVSDDSRALFRTQQVLPICATQPSG